MLLRCLIAASVLAASGLGTTAAAAESGYVAGYVLVALNPQPEPPGRTGVVTESVHVRSGRLELNPQPEPPGITDARKLLPPGPCSSISVSVMVNGAAIASHAVATRVPGRCRYEVATPGAKPGTAARVSFSRMR